MWITLRVFLVIVLVWYSGVSARKRPTIKHCKKAKKTIDCRKLGFQNVPYDAFSVRGVKMCV